MNLKAIGDLVLGSVKSFHSSRAAAVPELLPELLAGSFQV